MRYESVLTRIVDTLLFPILFGMGLAIAWLFSERGWTGFFAGMVAAWGYVAILCIIERVRPFEPAWNPGDGQLVNDVAFPFITVLVLLILPFAKWYASALSWVIDRFHLSFLNVWPANWPPLLSIPIGIMAYDLGYYLFHRWSHTIPLLWRFHSVHHSVPRLSAVNAMRSHPVDTFVEVIVVMPIVALLGVPSNAAVWFYALSTYVGILTHANINVNSGLFSYIINTPELHRWHHSPYQRETDTNYGRTMIWDHVFGTYFYPKRRPPRNVGVDFPMSSKLSYLLVQPFTPAGHNPGLSIIKSLSAGQAGVR